MFIFPALIFDLSMKDGEIGSIGNNLGLAGNTSDKPVDDLSPYHRIGGKAMKDASYKT